MKALEKKWVKVILVLIVAAIWLKVLVDKFNFFENEKESISIVNTQISDPDLLKLIDSVELTNDSLTQIVNGKDPFYWTITKNEKSSFSDVITRLPSQFNTRNKTKLEKKVAEMNLIYTGAISNKSTGRFQAIIKINEKTILLEKGEEISEGLKLMVIKPRYIEIGDQQIPATIVINLSK